MDLTVLDAGVLIAVLDNRDGHHVAAIVAVRSALDRGDALVLPVSAYAETLVAPHRRGREAVATVDAFVDALPATVESVTRAIATTAAELRARHAGQLRLPDALVISTALVLSAGRIVTTERGLAAAAGHRGGGRAVRTRAVRARRGERERRRPELGAAAAGLPLLRPGRQVSEQPKPDGLGGSSRRST